MTGEIKNSDDTRKRYAIADLLLDEQKILQGLSEYMPKALNIIKLT